MARTTERSVRSLEQLKEGAKYLKIADQLVRDGKYEDALKEIAKARSANPSNLYALAYEDRVRSLLHSKTHDRKGATAGGIQPDVFRPALEQLSSLAVAQAQRSLEVEMKREEEMHALQEEREELATAEETRRKAIQEKIAAFITRIIDYQARNDFERALAEIERAGLLDPGNEQMRILEQEIHHAREEWKHREQSDHVAGEADEGLRRKFAEEERKRFEDEMQASLSQEEEAKRLAQNAKISEYLRRSREHLSAGQLDDALGELAFVVVIDPLNDEVQKLERQIRERMERERVDERELERKRQEERVKRLEAIRVTVRRHVEQALELARAGSFIEALRVVTRAYLVDPLNNDLQQCESWILDEQEKAARAEEERRNHEVKEQRELQEEELRRLERERLLESQEEQLEARRKANKEQIRQYLSRAREHQQAGRVENAMGEIALAFVIDPFDKDVKKAEEEILAARRPSKEEESDDHASEEGKLAEKVASHLANAEQYRAGRHYEKALEEVARAFALDPLNPAIHDLDDDVHAEYHRFQEEQEIAAAARKKMDSARKHLWKAMEWLDAKDYDKALEETTLGVSIAGETEEFKNLRHKIEDTRRVESGQRAREQRTRNKRQVEKSLTRAKELLNLKTYDEALIEINKGLTIDPDHPELKSLRELVGTRAGVPGTVEEHIARAKTMVEGGLLEEALGEIALGLTVAPDDTRLLELEKSVWAAQENRSGGEGDSMSHELSVEDCLLRASEFQQKGDFASALDEVAKAYAVDPFNKDIRKVEIQIRQHELRQAQREESPLKLIYPGEKNLGR